MTVKIRSYNEIIGELARKIVADSAIDDVRPGSVIMTLLEAIAYSDFENSASVVSALDLFNLDIVKDNDLDNRANEYGLSRRPSTRATGLVNIFDSTILKRSTSLYQLKPAPVRGSETLYVSNAQDWPQSGTLFIGRGTINYEGPVSYTSITNNGSYYSIELAAALDKNHLLSESIIDSQGTQDRLIPANSLVNIPANNITPSISYYTVREAIIPSGDDTVEKVEVVASQAGSSSNAGINTIVSFSSAPFNGASVTNPQALINGRDVETDEELRLRIKNIANTLARGTKDAILSAIIGTSDPEDNKQVASAVISEPTDPNEPAILYLDDGTGFQPSYSGQSVDLLINNATGKEEFLQLSNYPLPRPQIINTVDAPFQLFDGAALTVQIDDQEEIVYFYSNQFSNINSATLAEVVVAINSQSTIFKCRMTENSTRLLIYPLDYYAEKMMIPTARNSTEEAIYANAVLKFPNTEVSYIRLYKNNDLLRERESSATLYTSIYSSWNIGTTGNLIIEVDGTPAQDQSFTLVDFGATSFSSLTVEDWVAIFNAKYAGITAEATAGGKIKIVSNKQGSTSSINIVGGTYFNKIFNDVDTFSSGQTSNFKINRQNGNIRLLETLSAGDTISAGASDTKGKVLSFEFSGGALNLDRDSFGRLAEIVVVADASEVIVRDVRTPVGSTIEIHDAGSNTMRIVSSSASSFSKILPSDFIFISNRNDVDGVGTGAWLDIKDCGLFKVLAKGEHLVDGVDTYIDVKNVDMVALGALKQYVVQDSSDIQAFSSDVYPQYWSGSMLPLPVSSTATSVVDSLNTVLTNVKASVYRTNYVKITSTNESTGSIAVPVSCGNAKNLFAVSSSAQFGNISHIANKMQDQATIKMFKRTWPTQVGTYNDRFVYSDVNSQITASVEPGIEGKDAYGEVLKATSLVQGASPEDLVYITDGSNKGDSSTVKVILTYDTIGTQFDKPNTILDYSADEAKASLARPLSISANDNVVMIIDGDSVNKTIDTSLSRLGRVNSGSLVTDYPSKTSFSADDFESEPGVTFSTAQFWDKVTTGAEFRDYGILMRARNWYATGGVGSGGGAMLIRADEYGTNGEKIKFQMEYPTSPNQTASYSYTPDALKTMFTFVFGSGSERVTSVATGQQFLVTDQGNGIVRLEFQAFSPIIDLSSVVVGDIISIGAISGISLNNRGAYKVVAVDDTLKYIDIYNPDADLSGNVGVAEEYTVTTVDDYQGLPNILQITTTAATLLDGTYFLLEDSQGTIKFWYDLTGSTAEPVVVGPAKSFRINSVIVTDTADVVALKTSAFVSSVADFSTSAVLNNLFCTNLENGPGAGAGAGSSGFVFSTTQAGDPPVTLKGTYFLIYDITGSVKVWYDVDNSGVDAPPIASDRSIRINLAGNDSANTIATKTVAALTGQIDASVGALLDVITVTNSAVGSRPDPGAGTSGFTLSVTTQGEDPTPETINNITLFKIFPLAGTSVSEICTVVNESPVLKCVAVGSDALEITHATRDEVYSVGGPITAALSYDHNPSRALQKYAFVSLFDSINWVSEFSNSDPNFVLKRPFVLAEAAPDIYKMDTCPRESTTELGELFFLVPKTLANIKHHFNHTALSQLSIVSEVDVSDNHSKLQIKSKEFGSSGAVEVVGGAGSNADFYIFSEPTIYAQDGETYIETSILSTPNTISTGDIVKIENDFGCARRSPFVSTDTVDVGKPSDLYTDYKYNHKNLNMSPYVRITTTDVSMSDYGMATGGVVWRWSISDSGIYAMVTDLNNGASAVIPQGLKSNGLVASDSLKVDVAQVGSSIAGNVIEATGLRAKFSATSPHSLNTGDTIYIDGSVNFDGSYQVTVIDANLFYFSHASTTIESGITAYTRQLFGLTVFGAPAQGDFYYFANSQLLPSDGKTFAVWIDIDGDGTPPSSTLYTGADYKIKVSVATGDTDNQIASNVYSELFGNTDFTPRFSVSASLPASFTSVSKGDVLLAGGGLDSNWLNSNKTEEYGDGIIAGFPVVKVNTLSDYVDVVNPHGAAMSNVAIAGGTFAVAPTPIAKWNLAHSCKMEISSIVVSGGVALASTVSKHSFNIGDSFVLYDSSVVPSVATVVGIPSYNQFTFSTATVDGSYPNGFVILSSQTPTKYCVQKLGPGNYFKLERKSGDSPRFIDCGVAVDDLMVIKGLTFDSQNAGEFRVAGVENDRVIFENASAKEQVNTIINFNNLAQTVNWTSNSPYITGSVGDFKNLAAGIWVKKAEDADNAYRQIQDFWDAFDAPTTADLAVKVVLASAYSGITASALGIGYNQITGVNAGVELNNPEDISFYEGDCARVGDSVVANSFIDSSWFRPANSGTFPIVGIGYLSGLIPYVRVENSSGVAQSGVRISVNPGGLNILENDKNKYFTYKQVVNIVVDGNNADHRLVFLHPSDRIYKISQTNQTKISPVAKLGFSSGVVVGIDGYVYNTGLLRTVQRIVDGYEPNAVQYPGRKAIGGIIEILPPLIKKLTLSISVTTSEGVNLNEITNEIKSTIISYINTRQVGEDVILSQIVVNVMQVRGVEAVTMVYPEPSLERIVIGYDEKAYIESQDISVS